MVSTKNGELFSEFSDASANFLEATNSLSNQLSDDVASLECLLSTISRALVEHQEALTDLRLKVMVQLFEAGVSYSAITAASGLHFQTVHNAIRQNANEEAVRRRSHSTVDEVTTSLRNDVKSGKYPAGSRLPSTRESLEALGVGHITYMKALDRLVEEGLVERRGGRRVPYVADDSEKTR